MAKNTKMFRLGFMALVLLALPVVSGCATSRGTVNISVPSSANPAAGTAVRIVSVTDNRKFEIKPSNPATPSLKDNRIHDKALTSRAIARKRNGYGMAMGDVLLSEGNTVESLVQNIVTQSLREAGFRVLEADQAGYDKATPLNVDVDKFWAWVDMGFWALHLEFESQIQITGPVTPFKDGKTFEGKIRLATQAANTRAWENTINKGLEKLHQNIKQNAH